MSESGETGTLNPGTLARMITTAVAHAAVEARDARFDGRFFTGVTSTGVYCRCVCPARTPKPANRCFFPSAAAAEKAGFRPCLVCRPERAPGLAPMDGADRLAHAALRRIEAGALEEIGLAALAARLGVSSRHLSRVMGRVFGASPIALAQTHRLHTAKRLLQESRLPMAHVAFAAGFQSVRRFNAAFQSQYRLTPTALRRSGAPAAAGVALHLGARGAFNAQALRDNLAARAVDGIEAMVEDRHIRSLQIGEQSGWIVVAPDANGVRLTISDGLFPALRAVVAGARGAFDLDTDIAAIDAHLEAAGLAGFEGLCGLRLHGEINPFETAVRTILGQQVTRRAARTLAGRLVARFGAPLATPFAGVTHLFPTPAVLAAADPAELAALGMPGKRAATVVALAAAVEAGRCVLERGGVTGGRAGLAAIPGVGPWTIDYVALRGLGDPDAFPAGDAVLDRCAAGLDSSRWRPWRAYAAIRLWAMDARTAPQHTTERREPA